MKALYIGRFQPFTSGHLDAIEQIREQGVTRLIIGVGSCQEMRTTSNPYSYEERKKMILSVVPDATVVPIPDFNNKKWWKKYIDTMLPPYDIVFTNNDYTASVFSAVIRLKIRINVNATLVRNKMLSGKQITEMVPASVEKIISKIKLPQLQQKIKLEELQ